jgi:hypothetical protein
MDKKTYYVTLRTGLTTGEVRDDNFFEEGSSSDFEIQATPEEAQQLQNLFKEGDSEDFISYLHAHIPYFPEFGKKDNEQYDHTLHEIYQQIYNLGTPETQSQIEQMGILDQQ